MLIFIMNMKRKSFSLLFLLLKKLFHPNFYLMQQKPEADKRNEGRDTKLGRAAGKEWPANV